MNVIRQIWDACREFLDQATWDFTGSLMSYEAYKLLSHPEDRKKYLNAIEKLRQGAKNQTFVNHTGEEITIS